MRIAEAVRNCTRHRPSAVVFTWALGGRIVIGKNGHVALCQYIPTGPDTLPNSFGLNPELFAETGPLYGLEEFKHLEYILEGNGSLRIAQELYRLDCPIVPPRYGQNTCLIKPSDDRTWVPKGNVTEVIERLALKSTYVRAETKQGVLTIDDFPLAYAKRTCYFYLWANDLRLGLEHVNTGDEVVLDYLVVAEPLRFETRDRVAIVWPRDPNRDKLTGGPVT